MARLRLLLLPHILRYSVLHFFFYLHLCIMSKRLIYLLAGVVALGSSLASAHGSHSTDGPPSDDWATRHMNG